MLTYNYREGQIIFNLIYFDDGAMKTAPYIKFDELSHTSIVCTGLTATPKTPPPFCHQCKLTFKYTSSTEMETKIQLLSANILETEQSTERKKKAESLITKVNKLADGEVPLQNTLKMLGLNEQKFNKMRIMFD